MKHDETSFVRKKRYICLINCAAAHDGKRKSCAARTHASWPLKRTWLTAAYIRYQSLDWMNAPPGRCTSFHLRSFCDSSMARAFRARVKTDSIGSHAADIKQHAATCSAFNTSIKSCLKRTSQLAESSSKREVGIGSHWTGSAGSSSCRNAAQTMMGWHEICVTGA